MTKNTKTVLLVFVLLLLLAAAALVFLPRSAQGDNPSLPDIDAPSRPSRDDGTGSSSSGGAEKAGLTLYSNSASKDVRGDDGRLLATVSGTVPAVKNPSEGGAVIDAFYADLLTQYVENAALTLQDSAASDERFSEEDFTHYAAELTARVERNDGVYLSVVCEMYEFTGGVHGNLALRSDTFLAATGERVGLYDLFAVGEAEYLPFLQEFLAAELSKQPDLYYENAPQQVAQLFDPAHFYLTDEGLTLYFQMYDVAPYAAGVPTFTLPYSELADLLRPEVYDALSA